MPAILEAWQPGSEGGNAVADVLFGDVNPGGKLPATFPRRSGQTPLYYARTLTHQPEGSPMYRSRYWEGPTSPLYPFGYGLSYTTFSFANLKLAAPQVKLGAAVSVSVDVTNSGSVPGDEVVQLYVHQKAGSASRPVRELKGFERVDAEAGRDADRRASRSARTSCATGARSSASGCRRPRPSTSGWGRTRRRSCTRTWRWSASRAPQQEAG